MTESQYIEYFRNLATQSKDLNHVESARLKSFFVVDNPFDLTAIDNAIRSRLTMPAMMLDIPKFSPTGNGSGNYTNTVEGVFAIIKKADKASLSAVRDECLAIGTKFLYRMRHDFKHQQILPGKPVFFQMDDTEVEPIGPIAIEFHGYLFTFRFVCPFGFSVTDASWRDLEA